AAVLRLAARSSAASAMTRAASPDQIQYYLEIIAPQGLPPAAPVVGSSVLVEQIEAPTRYVVLLPLVTR
ncbi:MAG TPA: hypothetical protein P5333_22780, partial [Caldilinea sp.]|nr:hypothetical protein [Caldilinea sp.]